VISLPAASWVIHHYSPTRVPTLILRVEVSFSPNFRLCVHTCCHIIATSPQTICHHHREASHIHRMTSYLRSIVPQTFIAAIEFIRPSWLKSPPPSESATHPAMADSHLDLSSLISGTSFVNVDALTISPTTWTTSHSAMAQRPPDEVHN